MRAVNAVFILLFLSTACNGPDSQNLHKNFTVKAQHYLSKHFKNSSTYQPVSFSGLDSIVQSYLNDKVYMQWDDSIMEIEAIRFREMGENFKLFQQRKASGWYDKRQAYFKRKRDSVARIVEPQFAGYKLDHHFNITDSTGNKTARKYTFCFDGDGNIYSVIK